MMSASLENFLGLLVMRRQARFLCLEPKQPLPFLEKRFGEIVFWEDLQAGDTARFDLIFGLHRPGGGNSLPVSLSRLHAMLNESGRLVIGTESGTMRGLCYLARLKLGCLLGRNPFTGYYIHLAYPSSAQPNLTCTLRRDALKWFFQKIYPQPQSRWKRTIFDARIRTGFFPAFRSAYLIDFEKK